MEKRKTYSGSPGTLSRSVSQSLGAMEKRRTYAGPSGTLSRSVSRQSVRSMSTRMKKVAPPPPPVEKAPPPPLSNGSVRRTVSSDRPVLSTPGEDCAIDELLEGKMDLEVVLPDCKVVRMTVDRKTPMMDLLVQATTSNKISPGGHIINLISKDERNVHYKPNTPIGSLDANTVYIIPKSTLELPVKRMPKLANQPFEQTFRLQVNLPLNQRMVLRVSPRITLNELKLQICSEKELDFNSHHLVHPAQPDTILDLNATLEVYGWTEISLMSNSGLRDSIRSSSAIITQAPRLDEEKRRKGILRLFSRRKRDFNTETPTNGVNHIPSSQSDGATLNRNSYQPKHSLKRKPAPAPPSNRNSSPPLITQSSNSINSRPESEISAKTADEIESSVSHSRHSSDSSGYHEPSVFSDCSENKSPEASIVHGDHGCMNDVLRQHSPLQKDITDSSVQMKRSSMTARDSNLKNVPSCSNVSIISTSRKRKAPQPPVSTLPAIESPTSPDAPPSDSVASVNETQGSKMCENKPEHENIKESSASRVTDTDNTVSSTEKVDSKQQESEALQYLEDVIQESEKLPNPKILDDSDTDSLKDEGEVISVCQAEVHANASDHDSPDSVVESHTVVASVPESQKCSFTPLSNPNSQSAGCEVVDTSADDSGISQSLNSDADSSVPSLNSDYKTMSDSGCQEDIYCNVTESAVPKLVPSNTELPAQSNSAEIVNMQLYESSVCDGASQKSHDIKASGETEQSLEDQCSSSSDKNQQIITSDSVVLQKDISPVSGTETKLVIEEECRKPKPDKVNGDRSCASSMSSGSRQNSTTVTPQCKKKLDNFVLSSYKKDHIEDIYSLPIDASKNSCLETNSDENSKVEVPKQKSKSQPDVKIVSLKEKTAVHAFDSEESSTRKVHEKCAQLNKMSTLPLTGRCSSMYDLVPQKKIEKSVNEEHKELILEECVKRTLSDQNVSNDLKPDLKACFLQEQRRLQEEYQRLQAQFISWQKQLMNNQSLLQNENILPQMPFTSLVGLESLENSKKTVSENQLTSKEEIIPCDHFKTRSLPRPKTKSLSLKEPSRPKTPPIPSSPTEASVVDIDIGTEGPKRPETLTSCSVNTQAEINLEDKVTQVPSPQDKVIQVPSPQEKVTSGTQVPSPETVKSKEDVSAQTSNQNLASPTEISPGLSESEGSKSQTLPRPKPKPVSAFQPTQTMTLNRKSMPKSQVVAVTIGSWQQRQTAINDIESANVASSRSKFQSLESIPSQVSVKPVSSFMEKRKLPPVPSGETPEKEVSSTKNKPETVTENKASKTVKESTKPIGKSHEKSLPHETSEETAVKTVLNTNKIQNIGVSRPDDSTQRQKLDIKLAAKEPTAVFKSVKPFVKLSSMKDESHPPSIIGLRKWPLSDMNESRGAGEGRQSVLEDLKASSKRPGGFVQDKIRRAEVDLRKPRSSKTESTTIPKSVEANTEPSKYKSSKTEPTSVTKVKEVNTESSKYKSSKTESTSLTKVKEVNTEPSKLHITKVSINNVKGSEDSKPLNEKKSYTSNVTTPVSAPSSGAWANTIPKSQSLNTELMAVFSKKANRDAERYTEVGNNKLNSSAVQGVTVNGAVQAPAPPPPPPVQAPSSAMPTIPPAEQIPVSSQLLMARGATTITKKESKKSPTKFSRTTDPREELMLEIRGFGGKQALRKLYEKSCLNLLKKSPKKKVISEESSSSSKLK